MSRLDTIYDTYADVQKAEKALNAARDKHTAKIEQLNKERKDFHKVVGTYDAGIVDPIEKKPFSLWLLVRQAFNMEYDHSVWFFITAAFLLLGFIFAIINIIPFLLFFTSAAIFAFLLGLFVFDIGKGGRKCQNH